MSVVAGHAAGLTGCFEAGVDRGEAGGDVGLGEGEEAGLGGEVGGFEVLRDLVEGLPDSRVVAAHGGELNVWAEGGQFIGGGVGRRCLQSFWRGSLMKIGDPGWWYFVWKSGLSELGAGRIAAMAESHTQPAEAALPDPFPTAKLSLLSH